MARLPFILALATTSILLLSTISLLQRWRTSSNGTLLFNGPFSEGDQYLLGVGKADITGPVAEINLMGYADPAQLGSGLRQRLYSRAFIVGDLEMPADGHRIAYLVLDTQSGDTAIRHGILEALAAMGGEYTLYGPQNVAIIGTHSHSGPGAWLNYLLPQITSRGFDKQSYQAIVDGGVASIVRAHKNLAPGRLRVGNIDIIDANINRSPYAYLANPEEERIRYEHDVDKTLTLLRFLHTTDSGEKDIGILTWFPVHGTSLHGNNTLITGDNKGVAAQLFEHSTSDPAFVAGFSQSNVGDTSPNILGAYCESGGDEGLPCDFRTSLCGNKTQPCHGRGPYFGRNDAGTSSAYEIGRRQFEGARRLFDHGNDFTPVRGKVVRSFHRFEDLSTYTFPLANGTMASTCPAAMGYSFAAGTSDGPGAFDFKQAQPGDPNANPLWTLIGHRIAKPNDTQKACHHGKAILLDVGESDTPYAWSPNIVDIMSMRVGNLFIIIAPGEATTMAGRRWKEALKESATTFVDDPMVVLGGPANTYTHYITTPEEYGVQRYEGASTLYGPHTLNAHINLTLTYLPHLAASNSRLPPLIPGPVPPIHVNKSLSFITPVVVDNAPLFKHLGDVATDVKPVYSPGDTITATFVGASPRNNFRLGLDETFAAVDQFDFKLKVWRRVRDDADWSLIYEWQRTSTVLGTSSVTISWETRWETGGWRFDDEGGSANTIGKLESGGSDAAAGMVQDELGELVRKGEKELSGLYRLRYYGDAKSIRGGIGAFEGTSSEFRIV